MGSGMMRELASPTWRVMLLSDGSVTRHLQVCFLCRRPSLTTVVLVFHLLSRPQRVSGGAEGSLPSA
jgi:hypothetical protein